VELGVNGSIIRVAGVLVFPLVVGSSNFAGSFVGRSQGCLHV
jgi:hypothetical protein